jgi:hypothetical protein
MKNGRIGNPLGVENDKSKHRSISRSGMIGKDGDTEFESTRVSLGWKLKRGARLAVCPSRKTNAVIVSTWSKRAYFFAAPAFAAASAYFFVKRSTRPAVSISFCLPVKNGWQFEQISTRSISPFTVDRVGNVFPHAQWTVTA